MQKLGIFVRDLSCSQLNCSLFKQVNKLCESGELNPIIFIEEVAPIFIQPKCAVMQAAELWGFYGNVICTTLSSAQKLIKIPTVSKKLFYVWDFEWLRFKNPNNELMSRIYNHNQLKLINRTEERAYHYNEKWGKSSEFTMEEFNLEKVMEFLNEDN